MMAWDEFFIWLRKYGRFLSCEMCGAQGWHLGVRTYDGKRRLVCTACQRKRARQKEREGRDRRRGQQTAKRRAIRERGDACEWCGDEGEILNLHHKVRLMDGGDHSQENVLLLCDKCHAKAHENGTRW